MKREIQIKIACCAVFVLSALPFLQTASYGLVNLDDYQYTIGRAELTDAPVPQALSWLMTSCDDAIWMPVTRLTYLLDCRLFGESTGAMHLHNVLLHACNAVLLFLFLVMLLERITGSGTLTGYPLLVTDSEDPASTSNRQRLTYNLLAAFTGVVFWAIHPLRVESVAWVASRKDLVSLFFELLALIAWIRRLDYAERSLTKTFCFSVSIFFFILSGMSKPIAMTFPVLAGLLELLVTGNRPYWRDYTAPIIVACVIGIVAQQAQTGGGATEALAGVPLYGRVLNAAAAFGLYCWKTVWPTDLAVQCLHRWPQMPRFVWQGIIICMVYSAVLIGAFWKSGFRVPGLGFGVQEDHQTLSNRQKPRVVFISLAFFLVAVAPTLGIANFGIHAFADRFTYLPAVGFSILLAFAVLWLLSTGVIHSRVARYTVSVGFSIAVGALAVQAYRQTLFWGDEGLLFQHTLDVDGEDNHFVRGQLGLHDYEYDGDLEKARAHMDYAFAHRRANELASYHFIYIEVLAESGDIARAREEARKYLGAREAASRECGDRREGVVMSDGMSYLVHAVLVLAEGDKELAKEHIQSFDRILPGAPYTAYLLGKIALAEGDKAAAVRHWNKSLSDTRCYTRHRFIGKEVRRLEQESVTNVIERDRQEKYP